MCNLCENKGGDTVETGLFYLFHLILSIYRQIVWLSSLGTESTDNSQHKEDKIDSLYILGTPTVTPYTVQ